MALEQLYSIKESAQRLGGLSHYTIAKWSKDGKLHATRVGRRVMIRESELQRLIDEGSGPAAAEDAA